MSKHTPGPWEWYGPNLLCGGERQSENILNSADDGRPYGHHAALIEHHWDGGVAKANSRLIAAAPDLLEALRSIADCCDEEHAARDYASRQAEIRGIARAAIAKAEGQ